MKAGIATRVAGGLLRGVGGVFRLGLGVIGLAAVVITVRDVLNVAESKLDTDKLKEASGQTRPRRRRTSKVPA